MRTYNMQSIVDSRSGARRRSSASFTRAILVPECIWRVGAGDPIRAISNRLGIPAIIYRERISSAGVKRESAYSGML